MVSGEGYAFAFQIRAHILLASLYLFKIEPFTKTWDEVINVKNVYFLGQYLYTWQQLLYFVFDIILKNIFLNVIFQRYKIERLKCKTTVGKIVLIIILLKPYALLMRIIVTQFLVVFRTLSNSFRHRLE